MFVYLFIHAPLSRQKDKEDIPVRVGIFTRLLQGSETLSMAPQISAPAVWGLLSLQAWSSSAQGHLDSGLILSLIRDPLLPALGISGSTVPGVHPAFRTHDPAGPET